MLTKNLYIIFGERDEIKAEHIEACLVAAGAGQENIVAAWTDCFV